ncbi:tRNA U34 5-methylaminomethyl-2-thiouridine-forming methyltransferase MnmC [Marivirga sericea]|uniref:tRNA U34 5-methylaminomethyl-2-thiouridine-forming methyltransferase MnmC n=1 Tax=Marivirga sericea TaxID=1028 RepID=A0A1X7JA27_9BACT|nr:tRNA (5-methylaminomethyl-2-thiouridine)(34)-methyltransferase MnmD [Marivirga sericea]SMG23858.1 tRNA U34 5-methylaminomethyl-2-thiouridine-forming methyltransferase MnmC [Marivirga sericea]
MDNIKIITTEDGSHSLYHEGLKETYHSFHGALQESVHVFIEKGVRFWRTKSGLPKQVDIFEVGFGTGLNALLAAQFAMENELKINFTTIEPFPLDMGIINQLNYATSIGQDDLKDVFEQLHTSEWENTIDINKYFSLHKCKTKLEDFDTSKRFDVLFFDAFAPNKQAELWTVDLMLKCFNLLRDGAVFTTYSAKGQLKRDLKSVGFEVETLPGPPGKKEMVRGIVN